MVGYWKKRWWFGGKFWEGVGQWMVALLLAGGAWAGEGAVRPEIVLRMEPEAPRAFQPTADHSRPTRLLLQLQDARTGQLISGPAQMTVALVHRKGWLSTGFPHLEGKEQLRGTFLAPQGRLAFDYLFPVRGQYRLTVRGRPLDRALPSVQREFELSVAEQPGNLRNAHLFLAFLLLLGMGVGLVFARSAAVALLLLGAGLSGQALAHGPQGHGERGIVQRQPPGPRAPTGAVQAGLTWEPASPKVGQSARFLLRLTEGPTRRPMGPMRVAIRIELEEDRLPVFAGELLAPDGRLSFALTFLDGSRHRVFLRAWPAGSTSAAPPSLEAEFPVEVEPLPPPAEATARSFGLLLGTVAVGLALGLGGGRWVFR